MNISAPFISRPVATTLLSVAVLLVGLWGYWKLPVSSLPEVEFPTIEVSTQLPGASPDTVALLVTAPLERQLGQIAGVAVMTSTSGPGTSRIALQFALDKDIDEAAQDTQSALDAARGTLPSTLPYPPVYAKVNPADPPIITLALTSDTLPIARLSDTADTLLAQKLSQSAGVGRVTVQGNMRPAVRLRIDPGRLAAYGLSMADVRTAVTAANANTPKGSLDGARQASTIMANDQITAPAQFADIIVTYRDGAPIFLRDLGTAQEGLENDRNAAWFDGRPAVILDVQRQPGANIVDTVARVRAQLPVLQRGLPAGIRMAVVSDRTETIKASVREVELTLVLSTVLVVAVIYFFLHSGRAMIVPAVSLPLSIIGTFAVMDWLGFSLDNLSLMALVIATGFVVDDAIVMIENIVRHIEDGMEPLAAAYEGARTIAFTIVSLTVSLIAVFIPLLFMEGVVGRLFREFAQTLTATVLVSMVVSLTLTPMMCALLLRPTHHRKGWLARGADRFFDGLLHVYERALRVTLRFEAITLLVAVGTVVLTAWFYVIIPKGFLPAQDTGLIQVATEAPGDVSFARMSALQRQVADIVRADPAVQAVTSVVGAGTVNATLNGGRITAVLRPREERDETAQEIIARLAPRLAGVAGIVSYPLAVQDIQIGARASTTQYQFTIVDADAAELATWSPRILAALRNLPQLLDLSSDQQQQGLQISVDVDRARAGRLGVTMQAIDDALYDAFGQRQISTIYAQNNQYRVILEAAEDFLADPTKLGMIRVAGSTDGTASVVPLAEVARVGRVNGPLQVTRENQFPAVTYSFNLSDTVSLGDAVDSIGNSMRDLGVPSTITGRFAGDAAEFNASLQSQPWLILAAVIVIYITLGVLYESLVHPLTILSTLPSAGIGALLALQLFGLDLSVVGIIGILLLMGIVKKNAIMMIDFALEAQRERGLPPREAITQAALLRFRPITMTTLAALLGALPLVLGHGAGSELRLPLGVSIVGGLVLSQFVTLFTTPSVYLALEWVRLKLGGRPDVAPAAAPAE
ncbi:efflux RND transporter permease subunit [Pararoseomonas indoligenes]|uniref:Efflux RND transporter permease subunit n=1 Tax=Roseomonas indoligenes TaxID=2820811 RepID=A0A940MRV6_9PROT|nr:efflux RND transporter permease subunit [Pararoseomonas indoligenes]MBP0492319.1 efflux RND transporter permease subunit [Pararoseomonas indoligenes]